MRDATEFRPDRGAWSVGAALLAATTLFFLLFNVLAWPEVTRLLFEGEGRAIRLVTVLSAIGGLAGSALAARRFELVRYQRSLGFACRLAGLVAALALLARTETMALGVAVAGGFALGWLAVTLVSGLRASVGTGGLGAAVGLGLGGAGGLSTIPLLADIGLRAQIITAALVILSVSVLPPFLTPQEPSVSPLDHYKRAGLARWLAILFGSALLAAALAAESRVAGAGRAFAGGPIGWLPAAAPVLAGAVAGWWLDRDSSRALPVLVSAGVGVLLLTVLFSGSDPAPGMMRLARPMGATLLAVAFVYYAARSGRAWHAGLVLMTGWLGWAIGVLWAANRFEG